MSVSRTTHNGRRITATPRVREQPDMDRLVALVLHLADQLYADQLHAAEQAQHSASGARDDHDKHLAAASSEAEEGIDDDTLTAHSASR